MIDIVLPSWFPLACVAAMLIVVIVGTVWMDISTTGGMNVIICLIFCGMVICVYVFMAVFGIIPSPINVFNFSVGAP
jgi:hypothetical protein